MATTTNGLPYPVPGDPANGPGAIQALAEAVDPVLGKIVADNTALIALTGNFIGRRVRVASVGEVATWTGVGWEGYWQDYTPALGTTNTTITSAKWRKNGKIVTVEFLLTLSGTPVGTIFSIALPTTAALTAGANLIGVGVVAMRDNSVGDSSRRVASCLLKTTTTVSFLVSSLATAAEATPAIPWTWATSDTVGGTITYREA